MVFRLDAGPGLAAGVGAAQTWILCNNVRDDNPLLAPALLAAQAPHSRDETRSDYRWQQRGTPSPWPSMTP